MMKAYTEEQRKALAKHAQEWIKDAEAQRDEIPFGFDEDTEKELALMKIALAALMAEPVGYIHNMVSPSDAGGGRVVAEENRHYGRAVYTAPPVAALRLPGEMSFAAAMGAVDDPVEVSAEVRGWNACLAEIKRLNGLEVSDGE